MLLILFFFFFFFFWVRGVVAPRTLDTDDDIIKHWVQALSDILSLSKISVRIVRFNYSPPPIFYLEGPIKVRTFVYQHYT
jgi:hypothetical protein